jgi:hypothetical protein
VAVDLGGGSDTLLINTTLTGSGSGNANSLISLGAGFDVATINAAVSGYRIDAGAANDTLVIAANVTNSVITGAGGSDSITLKTGATITGGQISVGVNSTTTNDGNDTITLEAGSKGAGTVFTNFSKANDFLIITDGSGTETFNGVASFGTLTGNVTAAVYATAFGTNNNLYQWLSDGGNAITLI